MDDETRRVAAELEDALLPLRPTVKAMFGGYCYYVDGKVVGLINDGRVFIKRSDADEAIESVAELAPAYPGATPSWRVPAGMQVDDPEGLLALVAAAAQALPVPKPRRRR